MDEERQIESELDKKDVLIELFKEQLDKIGVSSYSKVAKIITAISNICALSQISNNNRLIRSKDEKRFHPIRPSRGDIYNAYLEENVGSELCGNHLVIIIQNTRGNIFGEKVNVLPIEGDGTKIDPNYQMKITNEDLKFGNLDKDPSRIILSDIITIDKARLDKVKIGKAKPEKLVDINTAIKRQLEISP